MSNAIGLNSQTAPSIEVLQVTSVEPITATHSCKNGECSEQGSAFLKLLNVELNALVDTEEPDVLALSDPQLLEIVEEVEELSEFDISNPVLTSLLQQEEKSVEFISTDLQKLETEFKHALSELPEDVIALPLTPENKAIIEQQVLALVQHKHTELIAQIQQTERQFLPLEGKLLPLIEDALGKQDSLKNIQATLVGTSEVTQDVMDKKLSTEAQTNKTPLELLLKNDLDVELDNSFKNILDQKGKFTDVSKNETMVETSVPKTIIQAEITPQKLSAEVLSTPLNHVLVANQASGSTPTAAAVQSGSTTLLLPQNPTTDQWSGALGNKVQWMINSKLESAELRIDPPHLGKIDISIKMTDEGAKVVIQTQHAATRELIDAASYRLKEMLEQAGHERVDVDVSHKESQQSESQFSQRDESKEKNSIDNLNEIEALDVTDKDIIAGALTHERPVLDLFA